MTPEIVAPPTGFAFAARFMGEEFVGYYAAENWLRERGYSLGSMQCGAPTGVMLGNFGIEKWRHLSASERASLDGEIVEVERFRVGCEVRLRVVPVGLAA